MSPAVFSLNAPLICDKLQLFVKAEAEPEGSSRGRDCVSKSFHFISTYSAVGHEMAAVTSITYVLNSGQINGKYETQSSRFFFLMILVFVTLNQPQ